MTISMKYIAIFGLFFFLISCTDTAPESNDTAVETNDVETRREKARMNLHVKLDNGRQWEANRETVLGIDKMKQTVIEYGGNKIAPEEYQDLSKRLMEHFEYIFQECTMKGEAHNQLHNYLLPMKVYFEELHSDDRRVAENAVTKFREHLNAFPKYFRPERADKSVHNKK